MALLGATVATWALTIGAIVMSLDEGPGPNTLGFGGGFETAIPPLLLSALAATLGGLVVWRQPELMASGLLLLVIGLLMPWIFLPQVLADMAFVSRSIPTSLGTIAAFAGISLFVVWALIAEFLLRFPTGRFAGRGWRYVAWAARVGAGLTALNVVNSRLFAEEAGDADFLITPGATNPIAIDAIPRDVFDTAFNAGIVLLYAGLLGGVASIVVRFFKSEGEERQQLKVVAFAFVGYVGIAIAAANLDQLGGAFHWFFENALGPLIIVIPIAFGVALLRYRLYDLDVVISKAIVYGSLIVVITAWGPCQSAAPCWERRRRLAFS